MAIDPLPAAPPAYEKANEQRTRSLLEERLSDIEAALYALRTSYGTLSLGEATLTLSNGANANVAPGYATYVRITGPTGAFSVSGFTSGERGRLMLVRNTTSQDWTITNDATSTATNRIVTGTGSDITLTGTGGGAAVFLYDGTSERWVVIATQG